MPLITVENDPAIYRAVVDAGEVSIDGLEFESRWMDLEDQTDRGSFVELVREMSGPDDVVAGMTDHQLYAFGGKVLVEVRRLGKDVAESPALPEPTGSGG